VHSYLSVYEEILAPYRTTAKNILEIGLFNGASLLMWEQYFAGAVFGIDCSETPHGGMADLRPLIKEGTHNIFICDAESREAIKKCFHAFDDIKFDVIIEDAGHDVEQQVKIYYALKPFLNKGSIYIIEDVQNIDKDKISFENIDREKEVTIIDRRNLRERYDDVIVIIKDKK
jgi:cephalosporin hydroxylase